MLKMATIVVFLRIGSSIVTASLANDGASRKNATNVIFNRLLQSSQALTRIAELIQVDAHAVHE